MGWLFLLILVILFLTPLFIPFILRLQMTTGSRLVWSLHYGFILIAPDGLVKLKELFSKWSGQIKRILLPLKPLFLLSKILLKFLFRFISVIYRVIRRGVGFLIKLFKWFRRHIRRITEPGGEGLKSPERFEDIKDEEPIDKDRTKTSESGEPGFPEREEFPGSDGSEIFSPGERSEKIPDRDKLERSEEFDDSAGKGFNWISWMGAKIRQASKLYHLYLSYREQYGSLLSKTIRLLFQFLRMILRSLSIPRMKATFTTAGDPAMLGQLMGWYHALGGVIHQDFKRVIQLNPDFQNHDFALTVDSALEIRLYPYKFVMAILVLLFRFPYYRWWKVYRVRRKETTP